jgi:hypothetical protein
MTRLSNRQYPMLAMFYEGGDGFTMTIGQAKQWDQRPFRSMLIQQWITYRPGTQVFHITKKGREAYREFLHTDIARKNANLPITAYFDPDAYKPRLVKGRAA